MLPNQGASLIRLAEFQPPVNYEISESLVAAFQQQVTLGARNEAAPSQLLELLVKSSLLRTILLSQPPTLFVQSGDVSHALFATAPDFRSSMLRIAIRFVEANRNLEFHSNILSLSLER